MQDSDIYRIVRNAIRTALDECRIGEYKPEAILVRYNQKLANLKSLISHDKNKNRKVQSTQVQIITRAACSVKNRTYENISAVLQDKLRSIPSAIDLYMKEKKK